MRFYLEYTNYLLGIINIHTYVWSFHAPVLFQLSYKISRNVSKKALTLGVKLEENSLAAICFNGRKIYHITPTNSSVPRLLCPQMHVNTGKSRYYHA